MLLGASLRIRDLLRLNQRPALRRTRCYHLPDRSVLGRPARHKCPPRRRLTPRRPDSQRFRAHLMGLLTTPVRRTHNADYPLPASTSDAHVKPTSLARDGGHSRRRNRPDSAHTASSPRGPAAPRNTRPGANIWGRAPPSRTARFPRFRAIRGSRRLRAGRAHARTAVIPLGSRCPGTHRNRCGSTAPRNTRAGSPCRRPRETRASFRPATSRAARPAP